MILSLPKPIANDNQARQYWTCLACNNGAFLLEFADGETVIRCAMCNIDVTAHVSPTLEKPQCQP